MTPSRLLLAAALFAGAVPAVAQAQATDPAVATINSLDQALLAGMRQTGATEARARKLQPVIDASFDFPAMMRVAVGSAWNAASPADQQAVVRAFARFSSATYAHNFDSDSGDRFTVDPTVQSRGPDKLVKSQLVPKSGTPTTFLYRMRQSGGTWKIVDVFFNGTISELAQQRSDFQATIGAGGLKALSAKLNAKADTLLKS